MRQSSIYALVDPRTDRIRYVGKSIDPVRPVGAKAREALKLGHTPEVRAKAADARRGIPRSPETRDKIAQALMGHSVSAESRARMSAASRGRSRGPMPKHVRDKISQTKRLRANSNSTT